MKWIVIALGVLCFAITVLLTVLGEVLITESAPLGIVSFELAHNKDTSAAILDSWSIHAKAIAMLVQGMDFLYLFVYPAFFALCCYLLARKLGGTWFVMGVSISFLAPLAGVLDVVENYALIRQLLYGANDSFAALAYLTAIPKFAIVVLAITYILIALLSLLFRRFRST
ncbi:MAG: hypothetical protein AAF518_20380 [Spirochaetota bacterium]